jgi:hypothetical protein
MMHARQSLAILSMLLISALVGCGGGGDSNGGGDSGGESASLSKAEFIKQGEAICKRTEKERATGIESFKKEAGISPEAQLSAKQYEEVVLNAVLPALAHQGEELKALGVPDEPAAETIISELEEGIATMEKHAKNGEQETEDPFTDVREHSRAYGFKICHRYL